MLKLSGLEKKYYHNLVYGPGTQIGLRWIIILLYLAFAVVTGDHLAAVWYEASKMDYLHV